MKDNRAITDTIVVGVIPTGASVVVSKSVEGDYYKSEWADENTALTAAEITEEEYKSHLQDLLKYYRGEIDLINKALAAAGL